MSAPAATDLPGAVPNKGMLIAAVVAMLLQQTIAHLATLAVPVAAPALAEGLGVDPALLGVYYGIAYSAGMVASLACGAFILRFGGWRVSQVLLLIMAAGLAFIGPGWLWLMPLAAVVIGVGTLPSTPASSHILARFSTPKVAPLVFSVKQTGVPLGAMLAGLLIPFLILAVGWRGTFLVVAGICLAAAILLQPFRAAFDTDRQPGRPLSLGAVTASFRSVMADPGLRELCFAMVAFVGIQTCFTGFFVTFMVKAVGMALVEAGIVYSTALSVAIAARILWGWVGGRFVAARLLLAILGILMAAAGVLTGLISASWNPAAITAVAILFSATAVSWHGVLFSEIARLAPPGEAGPATGVATFFAGFCQVVYPLTFGGILAATGSFGIGYVVASIPALVVALGFLRRRDAVAAENGPA